MYITSGTFVFRGRPRHLAAWDKDSFPPPYKVHNAASVGIDCQAVRRIVQDTIHLLLPLEKNCTKPSCWMWLLNISVHSLCNAAKENSRHVVPGLTTSIEKGIFAFLNSWQILFQKNVKLRTERSHVPTWSLSRAGSDYYLCVGAKCAVLMLHQRCACFRIVTVEHS